MRLRTASYDFFLPFLLFTHRFHSINPAIHFLLACGAHAPPLQPQPPCPAGLACFSASCDQALLSYLHVGCPSLYEIVPPPPPSPPAAAPRLICSNSGSTTCYTHSHTHHFGFLFFEAATPHTPTVGALHPCVSLSLKPFSTSTQCPVSATLEVPSQVPAQYRSFKTASHPITCHALSSSCLFVSPLFF